MSLSRISLLCRIKRQSRSAGDRLPGYFLTCIRVISEIRGYQDDEPVTIAFRIAPTVLGRMILANTSR